MNVTTPADTSGVDAVQGRGLRLWPGMIFALLGINFAVVGVTVFAAIVSRTPVEPEYYQRAVRWDEDREARLASERLGWRLESRFVRDGAGEVALRLRLLDSRGVPIRSARVSAEIFHEARPRSVFTLSISEPSPGEYSAALPSGARGTPELGLWRLSVLARASGSEFLGEHQVELTGSASGEAGANVRGGR